MVSGKLLEYHISFRNRAWTFDTAITGLTAIWSLMVLLCDLEEGMPTYMREVVHKELNFWNCVANSVG